MLPLSFTTAFAKVLPRNRSSHTAPTSLPDAFDIGLTYDWSGPPSVTERPTSHTVVHAPSTINGSYLFNSINAYCFQYASNTGFWSKRRYIEPAIKMLMLSKPPNTIVAVIQVSNPRDFTSSAAFSTTAKSNLKHADSPLISSVSRVSLTSRKRKELPNDDFRDPPPKRRATSAYQNSVIDILDDTDSDDWGTCLLDTGYQSSGYQTPYSSASLSEYETTVMDTASQSTYSQYPASRAPSQTTSQALSTFEAPDTKWRGPDGGPIKFCAKPAGFISRAFSRWSYSESGPNPTSVNDHVEGDIHFSPSHGRGTNHPFNYWSAQHGHKGRSIEQVRAFEYGNCPTSMGTTMHGENSAQLGGDACTQELMERGVGGALANTPPAICSGAWSQGQGDALRAFTTMPPIRTQQPSCRFNPRVRPSKTNPASSLNVPDATEGQMSGSDSISGRCTTEDPERHSPNLNEAMPSTEAEGGQVLSETSRLCKLITTYAAEIDSNFPWFHDTERLLRLIGLEAHNPFNEPEKADQFPWLFDALHALNEFSMHLGGDDDTSEADHGGNSGTSKLNDDTNNDGDCNDDDNEAYGWGIGHGELNNETYGRTHEGVKYHVLQYPPTTDQREQEPLD
ncbi:hypothetical protein BDV93DRAFT_510386 [Ceratobasidium sp. AG-I]|nr:hypothetical protein BDV93DRAFT_510386 [Ceratobasidium sp. AG-I]